jgi:hypothetical protein
MENNYVGILYHEVPDLIMLTYPRSGRHWLYWNVLTNTDLKINFFHSIEDGIDMEYYKNNISVPIVTVVRSPEECLASINAMEKNSQFSYRLNDYINHYEFILDNADMLFLYEDLKEKTPQILKMLCHTYGGNIIGSNSNFNEYKKWYKETQHPFKLITSKESDMYQDTLKQAQSLDLKRHKELYLAAKSRSIML